MKTLFCSVYVLDRWLQKDSHLVKWQQYAQLGIYIGHCYQYSSTVPLNWNPQTKLVSPQFHIVFDKHFETVSSQPMAMSAADTQLIYDKLFTSSRWSYDDAYPVEQHYFFDNLWEQHQSMTAWKLQSHNPMSRVCRQARNTSASKEATCTHITVGTQTEPYPEMAAQPPSLDPQNSACTSSPKDFQILTPHHSTGA